MLTLQGERKGPQIDIPSDSTPSQLEELLNQLIESEEPVPFAFYIGENEIAASVGETLRELVFGFLDSIIDRAKRRKEWL